MILYHYTSGQGLYGILNSSELHCSHVNFMNDPSEDIYFEEILTKVFEESPIAKNIYNAMYNESYIRAIADPFDRYVASFSKNRDSLSMWNYYAKGNGYNIGVNIENVIEENTDSQIDIQTIELIYNSAAQLEKTLELKFSVKPTSQIHFIIAQLIVFIFHRNIFHSFPKSNTFGTILFKSQYFIRFV